MTYPMASLTRKILKGRAYYYLRECRWVNGKPKIVRQEYIGPADKVVERLQANSTPAKPARIKSYEFGAVAALLSLATELKLVQLIDRHVGGRYRKGLSVGAYLLVAAINRCVQPCSKAKMRRWYQSTVLPRLLPLEPRQLTSQRFWDRMDRVAPESLVAIDRELTATLIREYEMDLSCLFYDATNFFTFIDSFNRRSRLAQRGHCKHGRDNLRILGLALLVTKEDHIPVLYDLYPGNQHDAVTFRSLLEEIVSRYKAMCEQVQDITVVFDKGNNAQDIIERLDDAPYHFVGSLVPTQHPELLEIRRRQMRALDPKRLPGVKALRTTKEVFGTKRTIVVTFNPNLFRTQTKTLTREITKRLRKLSNLEGRLGRWQRGQGRGKKPTVESVQKNVRDILTGRHMKELIRAKVQRGPGGIPRVTSGLDRRAWKRLKRTLLGKTLIFTDQDGWTDEDIVEAYRGQANVEAAFRQMKDVHFVSFRPGFHWTDQKLRVHAFYCVLALTLCALLRRRLREKGISVSIHRMIETLKGIRETALLYRSRSERGRPKVQYQIEDLQPDQQRLFDALELAQDAA